MKQLRYFLYFSILAIVINSLSLSSQEQDYAGALYKTTYFLGAQRCGDTKSWMHGPCHTRDGERDGIDLTGGWHDCGDHIKFGQTNSHTAAFLLFMYNHFPYAYPDSYSVDYSEPPPNGIPDVLDEVKIFTDYLLKACVNGKVYYQVGDKRDHDSFSEPEYQSGLDVNKGGDPRYIYSITEGASNVCGAAAAALALMALSYKEFDPDYADSCLIKAQEYYAVGDAKHEVKFAANDEFYNDLKHWADKMALGAIELYRATGDEKWLTEAKKFFNDENFSMPTYFVLEIDHLEPLVTYELYKETNDIIYKNLLKNEVADWYYDKMTSFGYAHFMGWGSLKYTTAAALVALLYHDISDDDEAYTFGKRNIDFCLGTHDYLCTDAPANFSFVIGYNELGGGFTQHPHHPASFGKKEDAWDSWDKEDKNPGSVPYEYECTGALIGGPNNAGTDYFDVISSIMTNEVCIYYNASIVGALAYIMMIEGLTGINKDEHKNLSLNHGKYSNPNFFKVLGINRFSVPSWVEKNTTLSGYDYKGRKLATLSVHGRKTIDLARELGIGNGMLILKLFTKKDGLKK